MNCSVSGSVDKRSTFGEKKGMCVDTKGRNSEICEKTPALVVVDSKFEAEGVLVRVVGANIDRYKGVSVLEKIAAKTCGLVVLSVVVKIVSQYHR